MSRESDRSPKQEHPPRTEPDEMLPALRTEAIGKSQRSIALRLSTVLNERGLEVPERSGDFRKYVEDLFRVACDEVERLYALGTNGDTKALPEAIALLESAVKAVQEAGPSDANRTDTRTGIMRFPEVYKYAVNFLSRFDSPRLLLVGGNLEEAVSLQCIAYRKGLGNLEIVILNILQQEKEIFDRGIFSAIITGEPEGRLSRKDLSSGLIIPTESEPGRPFFNRDGDHYFKVTDKFRARVSFLDPGDILDGVPPAAGKFHGIGIFKVLEYYSNDVKGDIVKEAALALTDGDAAFFFEPKPGGDPHFGPATRFTREGRAMRQQLIRRNAVHSFLDKFMSTQGFQQDDSNMPVFVRRRQDG